MKTITTFVPLLLIGLLCACSAGVTLSKLDPNYKPNYLIVHPDGYALDDKNNPLSTPMLTEQLTDELVSHMSRLATELQANGTESGFAACHKRLSGVSVSLCSCMAASTAMTQALSTCNN
ncbi:MAG TPA: hypothetical protein VL329_04890 [Nitrospiraceae bacterium]|nr:hypothetical protein [Nitrospiraceae bacterium]